MEYKTISGHAEAEFVERKSRFISYISHVETNDEAVDFINKIRSMHRKATHNVYAYILRDGSIARYSDDGEPQGTAAVPVLDVLQKEGLTDVCCVITRYFGGILLGGGGLVRAYSHACKMAVDASKIKLMCSCFEISAVMDYSLYKKVTYVLSDFDIKIVGTDFSTEVKLKLLVKAESCDSLIEKLTDISCGQIILSKSDELYADFA
ncbi:MAG: YigZ family protein [Oscillospiraceae bacterium]|jgi:uncharacterized YigZ family protein